jgi:hypothetical protein
MEDPRFSEDPSDIERAVAAAAAAGPTRKLSEKALATSDLKQIQKYADEYLDFNGKQIGIIVRDLARDGANRGNEYLRKVASIVQELRASSDTKSKRGKARKVARPVRPTVVVAPMRGPVCPPEAVTSVGSSSAVAKTLVSLPASTMDTLPGPAEVPTESDLSAIIGRRFKGKVFLGPETLKRFYIGVDRKKNLDTLRALAADAAADPASMDYKHSTLHPEDAAIFDAVIASMR